MKSKIVLSVISISLLADGGAAIITKTSATNPSPNGVHKVNAGQLSRIVNRALGFNSPIAFKHLVDLGGCQLTIDSELCKAGEAWENKATGETGTYGDKDWTKYSNHEMVLSFAAKMKIAELSIQSGLNSVPVFQQTAPAVKAEAKVEDKVEATTIENPEV